MKLFNEIKQIAKKFIWKYKHERRARKTLKRKSYEWRPAVAKLKILYNQYSEVVANEQKDQLNGIESTEICPNTYRNVVYNTVGIADHWAKDN